jgi:ABC-2 type transport system permease protein
MKRALRAYGLLLHWQFLRSRQDLVIIIFIQLALALGIVYGLAFLIPQVDSETALYLATGSSTLTMLIMGFNVVPQEVSQAKISGQSAYLASLPIPRLAAPAAGVTFWLIAQLPGMVLAIVLASIRFDFDLRINPAVVPSVILVALTGASVGYALAMLLKPAVASQLSQFISIGVLLFSPINFPMDRLPDFLQGIHRVLPVKYMADLVRWSLTGRFVENVGLAFAVVAAWCLAGIAASWRVAVRKV